MKSKTRGTKLISLYPLKFQEVIADVLKVKPEPKAMKPIPRKKVSRRKGRKNLK